MKRLSIILLLAALLSGCALQMVRQAETDCRAALKDPKLDPLRGKVFPIPEELTLEMLNDERVLQPHERPTVFALDDVLMGCSKKIAAELKEVAPDFAAVVTEAADRHRRLRLWLLSEKLSFGAYNQGARQIHLEYEAKLTQAQAAFNARFQAGLAGMAATQQMIQSMQPVYTPPRTTTCTPFGGQVRCTTF